MKNFQCRCGQRIFFDNTTCTGCGADLGFDSTSLELVPLSIHSTGCRVDDAGGQWRHCQNREEYELCNWLVPADSPRNFCDACALNDVIPNLETRFNLVLWSRLEAAKRRLLYSLIGLGLPLAGPDGQPEPRFRFLEDQRRNPDVFEQFVSTGHVRGTITINLAEADDVARHEVRERMLERYRTLLGHFRHEAGHYYYDLLVPEGPDRDEFRKLFGNERLPYETALEKYYRDGPPAGWPSRFVSAYAASHPHEDWAETFAHYLHIRDALETADSSGLMTAAGDSDWIVRWMTLAVTLNELNRSLGTDDPYPFVLADPAAERLRFIDRQLDRAD
jgi:hypothetical protein